MTSINRRNFIVLGGAGTVALAAGIPALAADWPAKPVTVVVPYPAGGGSDTVARTVANALSNPFKQTFVIENHGGAAGSIGGGVVSRAAPDGYTIMIGGSAPLAANKLVQKGLAYDPQTDFAPLSLVGETPLVVLAGAGLPANSIQEVVAYAKANPGKLACGNAGAGAKGHIAAALLAQKTGIELNYAAYKGSAPLLADLLGGHLTFAIDTISTYLPHIEAGTLKALAVTTSSRSPRLPDVPPVAEEGVEGYEASLWYGAVAPAGTPDDVAEKIAAAIKDWFATSEGQEAFAKLGVTPIGGSPADLRATMDSEIESLRPLVESGAVSAN